MKIKSLYSIFFLLAICALLAIGRVYDSRLLVFGINLSLILSCTYFSFLMVFLFSIKNIFLNKTRLILYSFFAFVILITPILWTVYGINALPISTYGNSYQDYILHTSNYGFLGVSEYGVLKYLNFVLITVPISFVILQIFKYSDVKNLFLILLAVVLLLLFFAITGLFETPREDGRISVIGCGPIVFGRWMGFGALTLFFLPIKIKNLYRFTLIILLILYCFSSGSRGPVLSLLLTFLLYFFLNFRFIFIRFIVFMSLLISIFFVTNISNNLSEFGKADRVFVNFASKGGSSQSTQTRFELVDRSLDLMFKYPFGVGVGNWQIKANEYNPNFLMPHKYPHNLLLELINEHGIIAACLFLLFIMYAFYFSYVNMKRYLNDKSSLYALLFYMSIFLFLNVMLSGSLNDSRLLFVTLCCVLINSPLIIKYEK